MADQQEPKPLSERGKATWQRILGLGPDDPIPPGCAEPIYSEDDTFSEFDFGDEDSV